MLHNLVQVMEHPISLGRREFDAGKFGDALHILS
jgi:hypothetical protein